MLIYFWSSNKKSKLHVNFRFIIYPVTHISCIFSFIDVAIRDLETYFGEHQEFGGHLFAVQDKRFRNLWMKVNEAPQMMRFEKAPQLHFEERAKLLIKAVFLRQADFLDFFLDADLVSS